MTQIFIFGSSGAYGAGGVNGSWADILKQKLHTRMYSKNGVGDKYEIFNFAKAGEPIEFVLDTFKYFLEKYKRSGKVIILVSVGGNNSKAEDEPTNFISTIEEYKEKMFKLLTELKNNSDEVIFVGGGCVDESKTNPKPNPLTGGRSYFLNKRRAEFERVLDQVCSNIGITNIKTGVNNEEWIEKYLSEDGLHSNYLGYQLIADKIWTEIAPLLD